MTKRRWLWHIQLVAVVGGLSLAQPVSAAANFDSGDSYWSNSMLGMSSGGDYPLQAGHNGDSVYSYGLTCFEDGCDGLVWGGSLLSASWSVDIASDNVDYKFTALEGTDSGDVSTDLSTYLLFHTDRTPIVSTLQSVSTTPAGPDCVDCIGALSLSYASQADSNGGYDVSVFVDSDAFVSDGENQVNHDLHIFVSEVPEPMTWEVILSGFAAIGVALRLTQGGRSPLLKAKSRKLSLAMIGDS